MSGVFYAYAKRIPNNSNAAEKRDGRFLLTFPSRYEADEYYRALQQLLNTNGTRVFTTLQRASAQVWLWESTEGGWSIVFNHERDYQPTALMNIFRTMRQAVIGMCLGNFENRLSMPIFTNPVTGPDWNSGGTFYIRNRRQPDLYWWVHDRHLHTYPHQRTKFRIRAVSRAPNFAQSTTATEVMIRDDTVTVEVMQPKQDASTQPQFLRYTRSPYVKIELTDSASNAHWRFGTLVNRDVGVLWEVEQSDTTKQLRPFLAIMEEDGGDEWELV